MTELFQLYTRHEPGNAQILNEHIRMHINMELLKPNNIYKALYPNSQKSLMEYLMGVQDYVRIEIGNYFP